MIEYGLRPGVYQSECGKRRTLLAAIGRDCIYTFDDITHNDAVRRKLVRATVCSARTFVEAVGSTPVHEFSPEQAYVLACQAISLRPRRRCNKKERALFFREADAEKEVDADRSDRDDDDKEQPTEQSVCASPRMAFLQCLVKSLGCSAS